MEIRLHNDKATSQWWVVDAHGRRIPEPNKFLTALKTRGLSVHTLRAYGFDLVTLYRWLNISGKNLSELEHRDLLAFIDSQQQANIHPRSINRRLMTIRCFYRFVTGKQFKDGKGVSVPAAYYKGRGHDRYLGLHSVRQPRHRLLRVKTPHTLVEPLTQEQVRAFFQTLVRYRDLCIVYLMLFCGLRSQEVLDLKLQDICLEENRIRVHGKGNKQRMLPLPPALGETLKRYLRVERPHTCQAPHLFVVLQGKRKAQEMTPAGLRSLFRHRRKQSLLKNANAPLWRHTGGTDMARAGMALPVIQRLMGHNDPRITLQDLNLSMSDISEEFQRVSDEIQKRYRQP